jgi:GalNAc-alpha-(1->4)-GalNAc-alpha-(1->3)-diNAcBac-PP-undecaprenol alpha-1,4-N-acetyl-D-galactosaminyltransferase
MSNTMPPPSNVACVVAGLGPGGAERVLTTLANRWAERGHRITMVTIGAPESDFFGVTPPVTRIALGLAGRSSNRVAAGLANLQRISALRLALKRVQPSTIVSFGDQTNVVALLAARGLGARVVVSERTDPSRRSIGKPWEILRSRVYPWTDALVVQTRAVAAWAEKMVPHGRVVLIENPLDDRFLRPPEVPSSERRLTIVGLGRLGPEKASTC